MISCVVRFHADPKHQHSRSTYFPRGWTAIICQDDQTYYVQSEQEGEPHEKDLSSSLSPFIFVVFVVIIIIVGVIINPPSTGTEYENA